MPPATTYKGPLKSKRKGDLQEISAAMGIKLPSESIKQDYENAIRETLSKNTNLQRDPRFEGIWQHMASSPSSGGSGNNASAAATTTAASSTEKDKDESASRSPVKNLASEAAAIVRTPARRRTSAAATGSTASPAGSTLSPAAFAKRSKDAYNQIGSTVQHFAGDSRAHAMATAQNTQHRLSTAWSVTLITLAIELIFVLSSSIPFTKKVQLGPFKFSAGPNIPGNSWEFSLPDILVLAQCSWIKSFIGWVLTSVVIPYVVSCFIVVPQPPPRSNRARTFHLQDPSEITFAITRLALTFYNTKFDLQSSLLGGVPLVSFSWAWDILNRFGDVQILCASAALAYAFASELHRV